MPELPAVALSVEERGTDVGLVDALRTIGNELDQYMIKEEMRLLPMMEQGGSTLIEHVIEDPHRGHIEHERALDDFRAWLRVLEQVHRGSH